MSTETTRPRPPRKPKKADWQDRKHLTPTEVEKIRAAAAKLGRYGFRDAAMVLIAFRHGLRVGELVALRRDQVDLDAGVLHVRRSKNGTPSTHPLGGQEVRILRKLLRDQIASPYVFVSERGAPLTDSAFRKIVARAGREAGLDAPIHPHMLRHACGYKLANDGQDTRAIQHYLGHRNIQNTVNYTNLASDRFKDFWRD